MRWQHWELLNEDARLTDRQREVLRLLADGKEMKEIAGILHVTPRTVAFHKYRMMDLLDVRSSVAAPMPINRR